MALYTSGGILIHPGKLVRSMIDTLPKNIELYENSQLLEWKKKKDKVYCKFKNNNIVTKKLFFVQMVFKIIRY